MMTGGLTPRSPTAPHANNPTPQAVPPPEQSDSFLGGHSTGEKHVFVMVGLPARGKTHMARKLVRYLSFFHGADARVFNVGHYRRQRVGRDAPPDFFDPGNAANVATRQACAEEAMREMKAFLFHDREQQALIDQDGDQDRLKGPKGVYSGLVGVFDATNSTRERRAWISQELAGLPVKVIFVESICTLEDVIEQNIRDAKTVSPDYQHVADAEEAILNFRRRLDFYKQAYETLGASGEEESQLSWVKLINCGQKLVINRIHGFLPGRIVQFLANMHATQRSFYFTRHGQSQYNVRGKIGGDSALTEAGTAYARKLAEFAEMQICRGEDGEERKARLWSSSMVRTRETAQFIAHPKRALGGEGVWTQMSHRIYRNLDELYAGVCDGMTYEEIEAQFPDEFARRKRDKLRYRYPRGESYLDIIARLDPLVMEMESYHEPLLIIGHQAVLRLIYAYYAGYPREEAPQLSIPLNTVIKLTPRTYSCDEERICLLEINQEDGQREPPSH